MYPRSYLMVAGDKPNHLAKIPNLLCDVVMINLEDGVGEKQKALDLLLSTFGSSGFRACGKKIVVRINPLDCGGKEEIALLNHLKPNAIRIPKIKTPYDVAKGLELIDEEIDLHLSIETKEGFGSINLLKLDPRVTTLYLGILDLLESLQIPQSHLTIDNPMIDYIVSRFLVESKMIGCEGVFFTFQEYKNLELFSQWLQKAKRMGFRGTSCISPDQVKIANEIFGVSQEEIMKANAIIALFEEQKKKGITGFSDPLYGFIDEPIYKNALLVIDKEK